ncbi:MAG: APC family permease [Candidatus Rokubacteria bacterium]|nr:APC family permease [Candidatus Rokubacteria bacterium]
MSVAAPEVLRRGLGLVPLAAIVFFNVSGGPYGIEDTVPAFGPGLTLLLLVVTPFIWSLPVALVMSELAAAMPDEGGYITWVRRAFGPFWSFQVGWWSWIDSFVDVAVYPALFVEYLKFWRPDMGALERWVLALAFIVVLTGLNLAGVRPVGLAAVVLAILALVPIALFVVIGAFVPARVPWQPFAPDSGSVAATLGLGLAVVMWNYSGWDTASTVLGETKQPERAFVRAQLATLPLIALAYVLPVAVGLASGATAWGDWDTGTLPVIAAGVGGAWLGHAVAAGAVISTAGLFMSLLLTNSRLPFVLARDGMMPRALGVLSASTGTPWRAVVVSALCYAAFAAFSFKELIVLNVWLYSLALLIELAAFLRLRRAAPDLPRPWRVPGGSAGAVIVAVLPAILALVAMATAGWANTLAGVIAALTGPAAWLVVRRRVAA